MLAAVSRQEATPSGMPSRSAPMRVIGRRSSVDEVVGQLNEALMQGTWAIRDRLPTEWRLTEELGVSRTVIREAVRALVVVAVRDGVDGRGRVGLQQPFAVAD
ncbi:GntR family transcriptional regulator [Streptomyces sanglieri]|uniref:GntR family transcriptional regulator n=2 Tax=Streptomyces TaxID=1883 RepID=A0ABW2WU89_9ACTN